MTASRLSAALVFVAMLGISQTSNAQLSVSGSLVQDLLNPTSSAVCLISGHRAFDPGISLKPSRGTFFADTETKLDCYGTIDGSRIAGPEKFELTGTYGDPSPVTPNGDTCLFGRMTGDVTTTIQTLDGRTIVVTGQVFFKRVGLDLTAEGTLSNASTSFQTRVAFTAVPDAGQTCVTTPIRGVTIAGVIRVYAP